MKKLIILSLLCGLAVTASANTFYRWQDAAGVTHYSERPPSGVNSKDVNISDYQPRNTDAAQQAAPATSSSTHSKEASQPNVNALQQACDGYRKNLALLQSGKPLTTLTKDGKQQLLSKEQRAQMQARATQALKACSSAPH